MAHLKIDYGIDLGTTNSAICRMEKGEPIIKKSDTLKDTLPSCVSMTKKKSIKVGDSAYNDMKSDKRRATKLWQSQLFNTYIEFKRSMGTDKSYMSSYMGREYNSEELSAEILKTLKSFITDEQFSSVVITVPAKFTVGQKTATMNAAKLAGFTHCELLQEPIAASMAYGLSSAQKNGYWMVFDFGGGTFDVALLRVEDGIMQVFDTAGDNYLGGKNLDEAIVDEIIVPYLRSNYSIEGILADENKKDVLREAMKTYAEDVKIQLSFKATDDVISNLGDLGEDEEGEEIELDLTITQSEVFNVMRPLFQKALDICKELLNRNNMNGNQLDKLILVGGPTHSPLIRHMLKEQITPNIDVSIDPMTAVATGAALYASTLDCEFKEEEVENGTLLLDVSYEAATVETVEWVAIKLNKKEFGTSFINKIWIELLRGDKGWSSGKVEIDENGNVIEANLIEGKTNVFSILTYDEKGLLLPCFPNEITIIQGSKAGSVPLPYNIGMEIYNVQKKKNVFSPIQGLEKNKPLPAIGVKNGLKTTNELRPGIVTDSLRIPIYQAEENSEGKSASCYEYVADVVITGEEVESLIPKGSDVDITLKVNSSEMMTLEVFFPLLDFTVSKALNTSKQQSLSEAANRIPKDIENAQAEINRLKEDGCNVTVLQQELETVKTEHSNSSEKKAVLQHLKELLRKIEDVEDSTEWNRLEKKIRSEFERLEKAHDDLGNDKSAQIITELRSHADQAIRNQDIKLGCEILEQINDLFFQLTMFYQCMAIIQDCNKLFCSIHWKNSNRARQLINKGLVIMNDQPTIETIHPIAVELIGLLPENERGIFTGGLLEG